MCYICYTFTLKVTSGHSISYEDTLPENVMFMEFSLCRSLFFLKFKSFSNFSRFSASFLLLSGITKY